MFPMYPRLLLRTTFVTRNNAAQKQDELRAVAQDADLGCFIFMLTPLRAIVTHNQKGLTNRKPAI